MHATVIAAGSVLIVNVYVLYMHVYIIIVKYVSVDSVIFQDRLSHTLYTIDLT